MTIRLDFNTNHQLPVKSQFSKTEIITVLSVLQESQWFIKFVTVLLFW